MDAQPEHLDEEVKRLQRCINDLVSVLALPAVWIGGDPAQVVRTLLDVLGSMLRLDFVYVRLNVYPHEAPVEMVQVAPSSKLPSRPEEIGDALSNWLGPDPHSWAPSILNPFGNGDISIMPLQLGVHGEIGVIVTGSQRVDFPQSTERLLITVAVNQAAIGLQDVRLLGEQRRLAALFDQRVAERTRELAAINEDLRKEIAERKRAEEALKISEIRKTAILESALDCIMTVDHEGRITEFNAAAERTFGYRRDEIVSKHLSDTIVPPSLREQHQLGFAHYMNTGEVRIIGRRFEMKALRADGTEFPVELSITRTPLEGPPSFTGYVRDISDRRQSEESFRAIVETTPEGVKLIARDGTLLRINSAGLAMAGAESTDLVVGKSFYDLLASEDRERYCEFNELICSGQKGFLEFDIIDLQGERRRIETRAAPLRVNDGSIVQLGLSRDITERKTAEQKLRESERRLRQLTETIPEMLWSATSDGAIDYCNARVLNYSGFSAEDILGDGWTKLLHPEDVDHTMQEWMYCIRTGAAYRAEVRTFHAVDHAYRWCVTSALPLLDDHGNILRWHGTVVDMHDWRLAQEELRNTQAELAHVTRVLTMGELTASIAHEVNQPLASIRTNAGTSLRLLAQPEPDMEGARELMRLVVADTRRASEIIKGIRAMAGRQTPAKVLLSLDDVIKESMTFLRHEFTNREVSVSLDLAKELPEVVADRTQLQQVFVNLSVNSAQAMGQSRGRHILIRTSRAAEAVCCSIEDSGPGIDPAQLPRLFDRFFTTKEAGIGLGLSISQSIIEGHGGHIQADNHSVLGGARFSFLLPTNGLG